MPIYEYVCKSCGAQLEIMHKISEGPSEPCSSCGRAELERLVSAAGFRLKGGGWYETDFKSGGKRNLAGDSGDGGAKSADKADSKSESKSSGGEPGKSSSEGGSQSKSGSSGDAGGGAKSGPSSAAA
ncbi:zinc ribbon domain-containing protein [Algiphilus sp. W345]|uniref:Zinc ribbon domain-containing protein n=1 Tax=Banduia mediterranea TaxID=3075609 RepID=A0ABU2WLW8_9GAMM|nr:zinc ribbon domain-containing protein [Algiphilus sp. W345]MDT0498876.1 zinc ribbon domain-containing protein [Algiphilus sp. W345]